MKKLLYIGMGLMLFNGCSQKSFTDENVKEYICYNWELTELDIDGNTMKVDTLNQLNRIIFATNGKYMINELGETTTGRWDFDEEQQLLITNDYHGELKHKIVKATKNILQTQFTEENRVYTFSYKRIGKID